MRTTQLLSLALTAVPGGVLGVLVTDDAPLPRTIQDLEQINFPVIKTLQTTVYKNPQQHPPRNPDRLARYTLGTDRPMTFTLGPLIPPPPPHHRYKSQRPKYSRTGDRAATGTPNVYILPPPPPHLSPAPEPTKPFAATQKTAAADSSKMISSAGRFDRMPSPIPTPKPPTVNVPFPPAPPTQFPKKKDPDMDSIEWTTMTDTEPARTPISIPTSRPARHGKSSPPAIQYAALGTPESIVKSCNFVKVELDTNDENGPGKRAFVQAACRTSNPQNWH